MLILKILGILLALIVLYILFLAVCSLLVDPKKEYEKNSVFYRWLLNSATGIALKLMRVRIHTSGFEKLPKDTARVLFVGNHQSNFDPIVTWYALKNWQIAFLSKGENFKIPIFGRIIRKCCFMEIDRVDPRNAIKTINKAVELLKGEEVSIGVYPEGTRSKDGTLLPFHNGVFKIAQKANVPVVVLRITGTQTVHKNFPFHHSDVYLTAAAVISADTVKTGHTQQLGAITREALEK